MDNLSNEDLPRLEHKLQLGHYTWKRNGELLHSVHLNNWKQESIRSLHFYEITGRNEEVISLGEDAEVEKRDSKRKGAKLSLSLSWANEIPGTVFPVLHSKKIPLWQESHSAKYYKSTQYSIAFNLKCRSNLQSCLSVFLLAVSWLCHMIEQSQPNLVTDWSHGHGPAYSLLVVSRRTTSITVMK